jgi:hypothetical protein
MKRRIVPNVPGIFLRTGRAKKTLLCLILVPVMNVFAADFGLVLAAQAEYTPNGEKAPDVKEAGFTGSLTPWVSAAPGEKTSLYLSGKLTFEYISKNKAWERPPVVELERTELNFRPVPALYLSLGRQRYRDGGGMIASGHFDGVSAAAGFSRARLFVGAFYTGLLYKKAAEILMTEGDRERYARDLDYGNLETYFASRRIFVPLGLEFPDLSPRLSLALNMLAQFDVNDSSPLHSQYLEILLGFEAPLRVTLTGIGAAVESAGKLKFNFAGALGADWDLPGFLTDMLHGEFRWGSGAVTETIIPFIPLNGISQGTVFTPTLTGLMNGRLSYTVRPHETVSLSAEALVFWRTDLETFKDPELKEPSTERFLGTEVYGSAIWAAQSALRFSVGGGAFFPGGAFRDNAAVRWKLTGGIIISL